MLKKKVLQKFGGSQHAFEPTIKQVDSEDEEEAYGGKVDSGSDNEGGGMTRVIKRASASFYRLEMFKLSPKLQSSSSPPPKDNATTTSSNTTTSSAGQVVVDDGSGVGDAAITIL